MRGSSICAHFSDLSLKTKNTGKLKIVDDPSRRRDLCIAAENQRRKETLKSVSVEKHPSGEDDLWEDKISDRLIRGVYSSFCC